MWYEVPLFLEAKIRSLFGRFQDTKKIILKLTELNQEQKINEDSKKCSHSNCSKDGKIFLCNECGFMSGTKITGTYHMRKSHLGVSTTLDLFCHDCSVVATIKVKHKRF